MADDKSPQTRAEYLELDFDRMRRLSEAAGGLIEVGFDSRQSPPEAYEVRMRCTGLCLRSGAVREIDDHRVQILMVPAYPEHPPQLSWQTPISHPNIRAWEVCLLNNYGKKTRLDEVCIWLWDMVRYKLYNLDDPLDAAAKRWAERNEDRFPLDDRDLRTMVYGARRRQRSDDEIADAIVVHGEEDG